MINLGLRFNNQLEEDLPQIKEEFEAEVILRRAEHMQNAEEAE